MGDGHARLPNDSPTHPPPRVPPATPSPPLPAKCCHPPPTPPPCARFPHSSSAVSRQSAVSPGSGGPAGACAAWRVEPWRVEAWRVEAWRVEPWRVEPGVCGLVSAGGFSALLPRAATGPTRPAPLRLRARHRRHTAPPLLRSHARSCPLLRPCLCASVPGCVPVSGPMSVRMSVHMPALTRGPRRRRERGPWAYGRT